jgi:hypothetical protein
MSVVLWLARPPLLEVSSVQVVFIFKSQLFLIHAAARMCTPTLVDFFLQVLEDPLLHEEEEE